MKIKKIILIFLFALVFVGCDQTLSSDIETPKNVQIDQGVVSWTAIADVDKYVVVVNTDRYDVSTNSYDLKTLNLSVGTYQISVLAVKGDKLSSPSTIVSYEVKDSSNALAAPSNVKLDAGILIWDKVTNATSYIVYVDSKEYSVTEQIFNLNSLSLAAGTYSIKVKAVNDKLQSSLSTALTFVVSVDSEAVVAEILKLIDETYLPNMSEEDFVYDYEYEEYYNFYQVANAYSQISLVYLSENSSINFFKQFIDFIGSEEINSFVSFKNVFDQLSTYGLTANQFSNIVFELSLAMLKIEIDNINRYIAKYQTIIEEQNTLINEQKSSADYLDIYNKLKGYVNENDLPVFEEFMDAHVVYEAGAYRYSLHNTIESFIQIATKIPDDESQFNPDEFYNKDELMFYHLVKNVQAANDTEFLGMLSSYSYYNPIFVLYNYANEKQFRLQEIDDFNNNKSIYEDYKTTIITNKQVFLTQIEDVVDYLTTLYASITIDLLTQIDGSMESQVTLEEIMALKNEISAILQETLPGEEAFSHFYMTTMYLSTALHDLNINDYLIHATVLGQLDHITIDLLLKLIADIDEEAVNDVMTITEGMVIPGELVVDPTYGYQYNTNDRYDYEKVINLILYIGNYLKDFKTANIDKFNQIEAMSLDNVSHDLFEIYIEIMKVQLKNQIDKEQYALISLILDKLLTDYPVIVEGLEVLENIGGDLINNFFETEAVFFKDLIYLIEETDNLESTVVIQKIELLFTEFISYNNVLFESLDQEAIKKLIKMSKVPMMLSFVRMINVDDTSINTYENLFNELLDSVATVIVNIISLEKNLVTIVDGLEIETLFNSWALDENDKMLVMIIISLDELFVEANETLIIDTIDIIFKDIFNNPNLIQILQITVEEVNEYYNIATEKFTQLFADVHLVADFDFNNLQEGQLDQIYNVFRDFGNDPAEQIPTE